MTDWKRFLIAVDETETSMKAVRYASRLTGAIRGIEVLLLHIYPEPPPDYYRKGGTLRDYVDEKEARARILFENVRGLLERQGTPSEAIAVKAVMAEGKTITQAIIDEQTRGGFGTVILGKRGLSRAEEFLFGSISSALVHKTRDCAVIAVG